jgi:hypothetical protein
VRPATARNLSILLAAAAAALAAALLWATPAPALPPGNLLANPAAEAPPAEAGEVLTAPQSWTQTTAIGAGEQGAFDSCYGGSESEREVLERGVGEAIGGGARFFFGGTVALSTLRQEVAVDPAEAVGHELLIGGDFGGYEGQEDHASLAARFFDGIGVEVGSVATPPPRPTAARRRCCWPARRARRCPPAR